MEKVSRKHFDLGLYLILEPTLCGGIEGMVRTVEEAIEAGITTLQLRSEEELDKGELYRAGLAIQPIAKAANIPFLINDHIDLALALDADGVHIGQKDLPPEVCRRLLGEEKIIGLSVGTQEELAAVDSSLVDYLGVGPIYSTSTKRDARPPLGVDGVAKLVEQNRNRAQIPLLTIGGINHNNMAAALESGVDGIAVISAICGAESVITATEGLRNILDRYRS